MKDNIGDQFQQKTKYAPDTLTRGMLNWDTKPDTYKYYPNCKQISLTHSKLSNNISLTEVLQNRKSIRNFTKIPLSLEFLSYLLWASSGIQRVERGYEFRTAPSAGALYPIETYIIANNIENLESGLYHYSLKHKLEELKLGDFREETTMAALGQNMCARAATIFIWTAIFERSKWKYKQRAYRYIYLDMGHIAQNLALAVTSLGLGSCQIGALFDDHLNNLLGVDGMEESAIYMAVVGHPR